METKKQSQVVGKPKPSESRNMKKFDLMKDKPNLDYDTLNYVWDMLWRFNCAAKPTNSDKRSRSYERTRIMNLIQDLSKQV